MKNLMSAFIIAAFAVPAIAASAQDTLPNVEFGDDSGMYTADGECDDPRFVGTAMAVGLLTDNLGRDASDCRALFETGQITFSPLYASLTGGDEIPYGDDQSDYANDGECDDIRFTRANASETLLSCRRYRT